MEKLLAFVMILATGAGLAALGRVTMLYGYRALADARDPAKCEAWARRRWTYESLEQHGLRHVVGGVVLIGVGGLLMLGSWIALSAAD